MVKKFWGYVQPFTHNTGVWQIDGQADILRRHTLCIYASRGKNGKMNGNYLEIYTGTVSAWNAMSVQYLSSWCCHLMRLLIRRSTVQPPSRTPGRWLGPWCVARRWTRHRCVRNASSGTPVDADTRFTVAYAHRRCSLMMWVMVDP